MDLIAELVEHKDLDRWLKVPNNLVGFCAGIRDSFDKIKKAKPEKVWAFIEKFEDAFGAFNVAKLKLGRARRNSVSYAIREFSALERKDVEGITEKLIDVIE